MADADDTEYLKLPIDEQCQHKLWKARIHGYEEAAKKFRQAEEKSPEFNKYCGLLKNFVTDSHATAQEKGLDATQAFIESAALSIVGRTASDVCSGIVQKVLGCGKPKLKDKGQEILLTYIEIEKQDIVTDELLKGLAVKNPKCVAASAQTIRVALSAFGTAVVNPKLIVKQLPQLMEDRDKGVRDEAKQLYVELFRWIGNAAMKPLMSNLKPVQQQELESEFQKLGGEKVVPTRLLRSQQTKLAQRQEAAGSASDAGVDEGPLADEGPSVMDPWELMEAVNILEKLSKQYPQFEELVASKKWQERKEAFEFLLKLLTDNPKLDMQSNYGELVSIVKQAIQKDANINVVAVATQCMTGLATGLRRKFGSYTNMCLPVVLEKFKEKKAQVVEALRSCADALSTTTTLESVAEEIVKALDNKNPSVKVETAALLARWFAHCGIASLPKKLLKTFTTALTTTINDQDEAVRDSAMRALGVAMRVVTEKNIQPFLNDTDPIKLAKIKEYCEKAEVKQPQAIRTSRRDEGAEVSKETAAAKCVPKLPTNAATAKGKSLTAQSTSSGAGARSGATKGANAIAASVSGEADAQSEADDEPTAADLVPRRDVSEQFTPEIVDALNSSDWKVRLESLEKCQQIIADAKFVMPSLGNMPDALRSRLGDSNAKIQSKAFELAQMLAGSVGPTVRELVPLVCPGLFSAMSNNKKSVRDSCTSVLNAWVEQCGLKPFLENELLPETLKAANPFLQAEVYGWLSFHLPNYKKLPDTDLKTCVPALYAAVEDRNPDVRKAAQDAVLPFMMHCGYEYMSRQTEKLKSASVASVQALLDKARPNLPASTGKVSNKSALSKAGADATASTKSAVQSVRATSAVRSNSASRKPGDTAPKKKNDDEEGSALINTEQKQQRFNDEKNLRILRWQFTQPRAEYIDQLKDQMAAVCKPTLHAQLFHADFKNHLKALDTLVLCLDQSPAATLSALDLILKWVTLRFFDTNPSVLLKCLEYVQAVFLFCVDTDYKLHDVEVVSFVPYLILKAGEAKDVVRTGVRKIFQTMYSLYPPTKLFPHLMEGVKSKNARQRAECLEMIGQLVEQYGVDILQPSVPQSLKQIAHHIGDKDNAVRNAALNTIVQAYHHVGDIVYKHIGSINDKDLSLLQERIRRSAKARPVVKQRAESATGALESRAHSSTPTPGAVRETPRRVYQNGSTSNTTYHMDNGADSDESPPEVRKETKKGMFQLDMDLIGPNPIHPDDYKPPKLIDHTEIYHMMAEPVRVYQCKTRLPQMDSPIKPMTSSMEAQTTLDMVITQIASTALITSIQALAQLDELLKDESKHMLLSGHVDQLLQAIYFQFRMAYNTHMSDDSLNKDDVVALYRNLSMTLLSLLTNCASLTKEATEGSLKDLIFNLITVLLDERLNVIPDGPQVVRSINVMVVKLVEKSECTACMIALIRLLKDCVGSQACTDRFKELVMKCLWKLSRLLPQIASDLKIDRILFEMHIFLVAYPSDWWKSKDKQQPQQPQDTPLRTIKTILHSLVKIIGPDKIMNYIGLIDAPEKSEAVAYLKKAAKAVRQGDGTASADGVNMASGPMSGSTIDMLPASRTEANKPSVSELNQQLMDILKKIGSKESAKQGLTDLYDFTVAYPDVDYRPYIARSSVPFQQYIERGLTQIGQERRQGAGFADYGNKASSAANDHLLSNPARLMDRLKEMKQKVGVSDALVSNAPATPQPNSQASRYMDNLLALRHQAGLDNAEYEKARLQRSVSDTSSDVELAVGSHLAQLEAQRQRAANLDTVREVDASTAPSAGGALDLEQIRARLEMIKRGGLSKR